jgi:hypothetical protein
MAVTSTPIFPQSIKNGSVQIANSDASNLKTIITPGADGSRVDALFVSSTDTSARDLQLVVTKGGVDYILGTISIPANAGNTNAVALVNAFAQSNISSALTTDLNGNRILMLENGSVLKARSLTTVTATRFINLFASYGDF